MKKIYSLIMLITIVITACAPSETAIQTAMSQTQSAIPTNIVEPIATPISFSELDLENLILQENDLPLGYSAGQASNDLPEMFYPTVRPVAPEYAIYQKIQKRGTAMGGVTIILYENKGNVDRAYNKISGIYASVEGTQSVDGPWEDGKIVRFSDPSRGLVIIELVITQCQAVIHIQLSGSNEEEVTAYIERLIKRLTPFVCI